MPDYSKGLIYKFVCKDDNITENYIGSTVNFKKRKREHKSSCNNIISKEYNRKLYKFMRETGGFDNWLMVLIKYFPCNSLNELETEEDTYIISGGTLNDRRANRSKKQYSIDNKKRLNARQKQYYQDHKEECNAKQKVKITCECGAIINKYTKPRHIKSAKHTKNMLTLTK